eukprot:gene3132-2305_t
MPNNKDYHSFSGLLPIADWIGTLAEKPLAWRSGYSVTSYPHDCEELVRVLASWISFTGWFVANEPISPPVLSHAFCQHVGRICDTNEPAVDMVIPMVIYREPQSGPDGSPMESSDEPPAKKPKLKERAGAATAAASAANEGVTSTDEFQHCWMGLIVNGFSEQLLARGGGSLEKMQDFVNVGSTETTELLAECRDKELMKLHDMVSRQMAHRLPGDFFKDDGNDDEEVDQDEQPTKRTRTAASDARSSIEPFEGWQSYAVIATVKRIRYIVTVYCPTGP